MAERSNNKREGGEERKRIVRKKSTDGQDKVNRGADKPRKVYTSDESPRSTKPKRRSFDKNEGREEHPRRSFDKNEGREERPRRSFDKNEGREERPRRSFDKNEGREERPRRSFDKNEGREERPRRSFDKNEGREERPRRSFDKNEGREERPRRSFDKNEGREERPRRSFDKNEGREERPRRSFDKNENREDRPKRSFDKKDSRREEKPKRNLGGDSTKKKAEITKAKRQGGGRPDAFFAKPERPAKQKWENEENDFKPKQARDKGRKNISEEKKTPSTPTRKDEVMPLNKYVAHCGVASRREAADIIKEGKIKVNGELMLEPGYKVQLDDKVEYEGKLITSQKNLVYVLLNKPKNYLTTTDDPQERKTVMELVADAGEERIYPVGRLDRNTSGLLLLTNDGELAQKLSHPKYNVKKIYQVTLDKALSKAHFDKIVSGLTLEDGEVQVDDLAYLEKKNEIGIEIHSGRNRIVRRIFEHLGYEVEKLDRVVYAGLTKKNIQRGKWRFLNPQEIINLKYFKQ